MSAELLTVTAPNDNTGAAQESTAGGSKPLHRFLKGEPKITGTVMLIMGVSFITVSIAIASSHGNNPFWSTIPPGVVLGIMFTASGIQFILTEHNPTKKTVTISLALSIISILGASWILLHTLGDLVYFYSVDHFEHHTHHNETESEAPWMPYNLMMGMTIETVFTVHSLVGAIILITMSALAGAALRSSKTQTVVMMTSAATEAPVE